MPGGINPLTFAAKVMDMADSVKRDLPWTKTRDPYLIWISEIILQQTRVAQGIGYYLRFVSKFPDIITLAKSSQDEVFKVWEGLGYYSRARNLHAAARQILDQHNGIFPSSYDEIIALKGIGPYTAAAITSFAFGQSFASIDGNAYRLIARINGFPEAIGSKELHKKVATFSEQAIKNTDPAKYNQAIMDIGAQICTPTSPCCENCLLQSLCQAYHLGMTKEWPTKKTKIKIKARYFHYVLVDCPGNKTIIESRINTDIWKGLYQLPMIETKEPKSSLEPIDIKELMGLAINGTLAPTWTQTQQLTHQKVYASFYKISCKKAPEIKKDQYLVDRKKVSTFAFPKVLNDFFRQIQTDI